jgi:hypothetical protein
VVPVTAMLTGTVFATGALLLLLGQSDFTRGTVIERVRDRIVPPSIGVRVAGGMMPAERHTREDEQAPLVSAVAATAETVPAPPASASSDAPVAPAATALKRPATSSALAKRRR